MRWPGWLGRNETPAFADLSEKIRDSCSDRGADPLSRRYPGRRVCAPLSSRAGAEEPVSQPVIDPAENLQLCRACWPLSSRRSPSGSGPWTAAARITHGNPAGQRIWAGARYVGPEEFGEYKGWWADSGKPIAPNEWAAARAIQKGETSLDEMIEIECFDGSRKTILNSALPVRGADGTVLGAIIVNQDISDRRRAERERESLLHRLQAALEQVHTLAGLLPICFEAVRKYVMKHGSQRVSIRVLYSRAVDCHLFSWPLPGVCGAPVPGSAVVARVLGSQLQSPADEISPALSRNSRLQQARAPRCIRSRRPDEKRADRVRCGHRPRALARIINDV